MTGSRPVGKGCAATELPSREQPGPRTPQHPQLLRGVARSSSRGLEGSCLGPAGAQRTGRCGRAAGVCRVGVHGVVPPRVPAELSDLPGRGVCLWPLLPVDWRPQVAASGWLASRSRHAPSWVCSHCAVSRGPWPRGQEGTNPVVVPVCFSTTARWQQRSPWAQLAEGSAPQAHGACPRTLLCLAGAGLCWVCTSRRVTRPGRALVSPFSTLRRPCWSPSSCVDSGTRLPVKPVGTWFLSCW